jgi:hypothetical protein
MPILIGRVIMRLTGVRPASENNITIGALNGFLGWIPGIRALVAALAEFSFWRIDRLCGAQRLR